MPSLDDVPSAAVEQYYAQMIRARHRLIIPLAVLTMFVFFLQQVLTNFTSALDGIAFSGMTWAYLYGFALFFYVVIVTTFYRRRMQQLEQNLASLAPPPRAAHYDDWTTMEAHDRREEGDAGDEQIEHAQASRLDEEVDR